MKSSDKPQFSKKWWDAGRPQEIKATDLDKCLPRAEKALAIQQRKNGNAEAIDDCLDALKAIPGAAAKTIRLCDKRQHKDVIAVLKKFDALVKSEVVRLEGLKQKLNDSSGAAGEEGDEVSEGQLFEKDYLYKMMKLMKSAGKELRFGFGLNTNAPESSVLLLKRKGKPELLFKTLKKTKQFSNRLLTYGYARPDPDDGQTLIFRLESGANEPPRILKLGRKYLRSDKKLRFRKLKLVLPSGKTLEDSEPDMDDVEVAAAGQATTDDLQDERAAAENFVRLWDETLQDVAGQVERLRGAMQGFDDPGIQSVHDGLASVMDKFPDLDLSQLVAAASANNREAYDQTLEQTAREVNQVRDLLANGPLLSTIDENPFVDTNVHATVNDVLRQIVSELGV